MQAASTFHLSFARRVTKIMTLICVAVLPLATRSSPPEKMLGANHDPCTAGKKRSHWNTYVNRAYGFCFQYPDTYGPVPLPGPDARSKRRPYEHGLFHLKRSAMDATILVIFNDQPFDLQNLIQIAAPTGNTFRPDTVRIGDYAFYYYGAGGGGAEYPDVYFFNLNGKTLEIYFSGPYPDGRNPSEETKKLESEILATFRTF